MKSLQVKGTSRGIALSIGMFLAGCGQAGNTESPGSAAPAEAGSLVPEDTTAVQPDGSSEQNARPEASSGTGSREAGTGCNDLENTAPVIQQAAGSGDVPAATGGTIVSGTYFLTSETFYGATADCPLSSAQITTVFTATSESAGTQETVGCFGCGNAKPSSPSSASYTINGTAMNAQSTCPVKGGYQSSFTASPDQIVGITGNTGVCGKQVFVWTRQ